ncbi:MAG: hypothetical protein AUK34_07905 [Ignavibacteria bacterium CG2_30_36_16]|nr:hypothetical protein [Ignavibacteria bacterium]OIP59445.1 MAG: hypothetical protein AUK34_07905 [Ignavibacteria bacterium CG2_30_36_16]PJB01835.1 MAG: hypothetical protein CO127_01840 [Ignavibacteria bacterium CG_4_9_14_3_um_filter_36_18]
MFSLKHYSNIFAILLIAISSGLVFFRFAFLYSDKPLVFLILYLLSLTAGVFAVDFAAGKIKLLDAYKQVVVIVYLICVLSAASLFIIKNGSGEPILHMSNSYPVILQNYLVTGILYAALIFAATEIIDSEKINLLTIIIAVLFGAIHLLANALIIPSLIFGLYFFRNNLKNLFLFTALSLAVFTLLNYFLLENNSSFNSLAGAPLTTIPLFWKIIVIVVSIYAGWSVASLNEVFITGAFFLCLISIISIVLLLQGSEFEKAILIGEPFVVTLIPMAIFSLNDYKVDKFLGKVLPMNG